MHLTTIVTALLSTALSAPTPSSYDPVECGYVLTERNSSTYASVFATSSCTDIYYNYSIPGYQDAYAYSLYDGCECTFHLTNETCTEGTGAPIYEGPTGAKPGKEPLFDEEMKPKWYWCEMVDETSQ